MKSILARRFDLTYPILQAPIWSMAGVKLAAAVSNAGGLGSLALTWTSPEMTARHAGIASITFLRNEIG